MKGEYSMNEGRMHIDPEGRITLYPATYRIVYKNDN